MAIGSTTRGGRGRGGKERQENTAQARSPTMSILDITLSR